MKHLHQLRRRLRELPPDAILHYYRRAISIRPWSTATSCSLARPQHQRLGSRRELLAHRPVRRVGNDGAIHLALALREPDLGRALGALTSLLAGDQDLFLSQYRWARQFHEYFIREQNKGGMLANPETGRMENCPGTSACSPAVFTNLLASLSESERPSGRPKRAAPIRLPDSGREPANP